MPKRGRTVNRLWELYGGFSRPDQLLRLSLSVLVSVPISVLLNTCCTRRSVWCRWSDSNRHGCLRPQDFKSCASAISPHRHGCGAANVTEGEGRCQKKRGARKLTSKVLRSFDL